MDNVLQVFSMFCDFFGIRKYFLYSTVFKILKIEFHESDSIRKNLKKLLFNSLYDRVPTNKILVNFNTYRESTNCKVKKS